MRSLSNNIVERYTGFSKERTEREDKVIDSTKLFETYSQESSVTKNIILKLFKLLKLENTFENFNILQCFINKFYYDMKLNDNIVDKINTLISENPELMNFVIV